jgi:hypothetical protein
MVMNENQIFQQGSRGCLTSLLSIVLAISALAASSNVHFSEHPACSGMLGGGFPLLFICDDWGGSSPTSSWGKIDYVDVFNGGIQPGGFLVDFLFYILLIWILWFAASSALSKRINHRELWWTTFIVLGFVCGFLFAFLTVWSSDSYIKRPPVGTPTPVVPSATALENIASTRTPTATLVP